VIGGQRYVVNVLSASSRDFAMAVFGNSRKSRHLVLNDDVSDFEHRNLPRAHSKF
jgi:hypothetical protein